MPSGAKRRKAAKKKQGKVLNVSNTSQQGNGDSPKSHDEKDSDSGSVSSPTASQEHNNLLRKEESDDEGEVPKDFSTDLPEPHHVEIENSQFGGEDEKAVDISGGSNEVVVTKEVDFESRVIDIEPVKESDVKVGERKFKGSFGSNSNGGTQYPQIEDISQSKEGVKADFDILESLASSEPPEQVVSITKEVIHSPVKQVVSQSEETIPYVDAKEIGDFSGVDPPSKESEEKMLPQSTGSVEAGNATAHPREAHTIPNLDNQGKDVAPVPPTIRPTSWKSCCGLFDVLAGSNR